MVPCKPFPLLKLPSQALKSTFGHIGKLDLIPLSLCSKKVARSILLNNTAPKGYVVEFTDKKKSIKVTFVDNTFFLWEFKKRQRNDLYDCLESYNFKTQDITVTCYKTDNGFISLFSSISKNASEASVFYNVFQFFLKTFPAGITELHLDLVMESEKNKMKNKENGFLELLAQNERTFCDNLILSGIPESSVLNFALTNIVVSKILTIQSQVPNNFVFPETVHAQCVIIEEGDWILASGGIFSVNAKFCRLENVVCRKEKCINIIRSFLSTPSAPSLEWLIVELDDGKLKIGNVLRGFAAQAWEKDRRDGYFTQFHGDKLMDIDCREGYDIERADGLLATVFLKKTDIRGPQQFHMVIWHKRFPNEENIKLKQEKNRGLSERDKQRNRQIQENEAKIKANEEEIQRMELEIEELRSDNAAQKLTRDAFESILSMLRRLKADGPA